MLVMCAAVAGATWKALDEVLVRPRDFKIEDLEKKVETADKDIAQLKAQKSQLEAQLADATKEAVRASQGGKPAPDARPGETVVNFQWVDTPGPQFIVAAAPYLHGVGMSVSDLKPAESELILVNNRGLYAGRAIQPAYSQNLLTQARTGNVPASFTLKFARPLASFSFSRPALFPATDSGVTHPAWSAHALDEKGKVLSSQSEGLSRYLPKQGQPGQYVAARTYTLIAPAFEGIRAVRFESDPRLDGKPFAAFSAVLLERLMFTLYEK